LKLKEVKSSNTNFAWVDITSPTMDDLKRVSEQYNLNNSNLVDCLEPDHLPKFEEGENFNFIILRRIMHNHHKGYTINALTTKIAIFFNDKTILTIHRLAHDDIQETCEQLMQNGKIVSVDQLLLKIITKVQSSFSDFSSKLNYQIEDAETRLFIRKTAIESIENLYVLKRKTGLCRRLLLLTGEVVHALGHRQKKSFELQDIRDNQIKLQLFYDLLSEDAHNLVSTYMSYNSQKANDVMKVLTVFSAFFLPLTFIVGVYGMNFKVMPELEWDYGYPAVWVLMVGVLVSIFIWVKRRNWL
jgi:magnesium transporter